MPSEKQACKAAGGKVEGSWELAPHTPCLLQVRPANSSKRNCFASCRQLLHVENLAPRAQALAREQGSPRVRTSGEGADTKPQTAAGQRDPCGLERTARTRAEWAEGPRHTCLVIPVLAFPLRPYLPCSQDGGRGAHPQSPPTHHIACLRLAASAAALKHAAQGCSENRATGFLWRAAEDRLTVCLLLANFNLSRCSKQGAVPSRHSAISYFKPTRPPATHSARKRRGHRLCSNPADSMKVPYGSHQANPIPFKKMSHLGANAP